MTGESRGTVLAATVPEVSDTFWELRQAAPEPGLTSAS